MGFPLFLRDKSSRPSHLAILILTFFLLALAIVLLIWAAYRLPPATPKTKNSSSSKALPQGGTGYTAIANHLVDPQSNGVRWIGQGQSILSQDAQFELRFTLQGNAELWNLQSQQKLYESKTADSKNPPHHFLCGIDGYCYVLYQDGSRARTATTSGDFYRSPNQIPPASQDPPFYFNRPYTLEFYKGGLVLYSGGFKNSKQFNNKKVPLWWICQPGSSPPPGIPPNANVPQTCPPSL